MTFSVDAQVALTSPTDATERLTAGEAIAIFRESLHLVGEVNNGSATTSHANSYYLRIMTRHVTVSLANIVTRVSLSS
ncbi:MAG: hypothetical protein ABIV10_12685 [Gemmatimonadaceae bacterium]